MGVESLVRCSSNVEPTRWIIMLKTAPAPPAPSPTPDSAPRLSGFSVVTALRSAGGRLVVLPARIA
jgi:hypothetical protein